MSAAGSRNTSQVNQWTDFIQQENHFNFINIHYLNHFSSNIQHFRWTSRYSTHIGELAYKDQIKACHCRPNKNEASYKTLSYYSLKHALGIRPKTLDNLLKAENVLVIQSTGRETVAAHGRIQKGQMKNIGTLTKHCRTCNINYFDIMEGILYFTK